MHACMHVIFLAVSIWMNNMIIYNIFEGGSACLGCRYQYRWRARSCPRRGGSPWPPHFPLPPPLGTDPTLLWWPRSPLNAVDANEAQPYSRCAYLFGSLSLPGSCDSGACDNQIAAPTGHCLQSRRSSPASLPSADETSHQQHHTSRPLLAAPFAPPWRPPLMPCSRCCKAHGTTTPHAQKVMGWLFLINRDRSYTPALRR